MVLICNFEGINLFLISLKELTKEEKWEVKMDDDQFHVVDTILKSMIQLKVSLDYGKEKLNECQFQETLLDICLVR